MRAGQASSSDSLSPSDRLQEVLDFLFKPDYGLNLQILKVEVGGDTDATEGAEPSHMHAPGDEDYTRGYEWWLMKEARARNPDIKLYGLPWGWPGWLDPAATPDKQAKNPFADPKVTANYTLAWLLGAKREHDLTIDYVGQWNERNAPDDYAAALREAVYGAPELENKTFVLNRLPHYPGTGSSPDSQGCTQYDWNTTDGSRWVDEEGSIYDGRSARCLARCVNRQYVTGCHTAIFQWHLVSSFYDFLPWARCGVAVANTPWSGAYEITSPTWALAHTTQFAPVGWRYAQHGKGVSLLGGGGSIVTRLSPDKKDFSIVLEKMTTEDSSCARGSNPDINTLNETIRVQLAGAFLEAVQNGGRTLQVWKSDYTGSNDIRDNPPFENLFNKQSDPIKVDDKGGFSLSINLNEQYTITTLTTGAKPKPTPRQNTSFPIPFEQSFDDEDLAQPGKYWYDQMGAFQIADASGGRSGRVLKQVSPVWPACWGYSCDGPTTYFGPRQALTGNVVSIDANLSEEGGISISPEGDTKRPGVQINTDGTWSFGLKSGKDAKFAANAWHTVKMTFGDKWRAVELDGALLGNLTEVDAGPYSWTIKLQLTRYIIAEFDNFSIKPISQA